MSASPAARRRASFSAAALAMLSSLVRAYPLAVHVRSRILSIAGAGRRAL